MNETPRTDACEKAIGKALGDYAVRRGKGQMGTLYQAAEEIHEAMSDCRHLEEQLVAANVKIAELTKDVYCCPPCSENGGYEGFKWCDSHDELEKENEKLIKSIEDARLRLCSVGLLPSHHATLDKAVEACVSMIAYLRNELSNPPIDVQYAVLQKLGIDYSLKEDAERYRFLLKQGWFNDGEGNLTIEFESPSQGTRNVAVDAAMKQDK